MSLHAVNLLKISITVDGQKSILEELEKYLLSGQNSPANGTGKQVSPLMIVTPNAEQIMAAGESDRFSGILRKADVAIPDGIGVTIAVGLFYPGVAVERLPGVDFAENLAAMATRKGVTIGLIGGMDGIALKALDCLKEKYPGLSGWAWDGPKLQVERNDELRLAADDGTGTENRQSAGGMGEGSETGKGETIDQYIYRLLSHIRQTGTGVLLVGFGAPKQEIFMQMVSDFHKKTLQAQRSPKRRSPPLIMMAVGGSFDIIGGKLKRAPRFMRMAGLEWLWRLLLEPWRWRRQLSLLAFLKYAVMEKAFSITHDRMSSLPK